MEGLVSGSKSFRFVCPNGNILIYYRSFKWMDRRSELLSDWYLLKVMYKSCICTKPVRKMWGQKKTKKLGLCRENPPVPGWGQHDVRQLDLLRCGPTCPEFKGTNSQSERTFSSEPKKNTPGDLDMFDMLLKKKHCTSEICFWICLSNFSYQTSSWPFWSRLRC